MARPIRFFSKEDDYFWLSNFAPFGFEAEGVYWPTVEHYFQAQKFTDQDWRERIRCASSPKQAKALGQSRAHPLRADWEDIKQAVMKQALRHKFADPQLRSWLSQTRNRPLIENSPYDNYWGIGPRGKGKNALGLLLQEVREELAVP